jgi:hypothetical protein
MIIAALEESLRVRKEFSVDHIQPDTPGKLPSYTVKCVWRAMLSAWRTGYTGIEEDGSVLNPQEAAHGKD